MPLALEERGDPPVPVGWSLVDKAADGANLEKLGLPTDEREAEALAGKPTACCVGSWAHTSLPRNPLEATKNLCLWRG